MRKFLKIGVWTACAGVLVAAKKVSKDPDMVLREEMVTISRQLGVTCTHCHDPNNFKKDDKKEFQISKNHMQVVAYLNSAKGFNGTPKADCYMCHRGEAKPPFREPGNKTHESGKARLEGTH